MGMRHGIYCIGCCWSLMLIMFVVGVMNVLWMVIIAGFVLAEKLGPGGRSISYISGLLLVVWGAWMLAPALL